MKTVTVVIPCFNEEKTIANVLDAIYRQSYPREQMEVVIADGFSTDGTRGVLADYMENHPELSITVVDNPKREIPSGLNAAIKASSGGVIVRMDGHSIPNEDYVACCVAGHDAGLGDNIGGVWDIQPGGKSWFARAIAIAAGHPLGAGDAGYRLNSKAGEVDTVPFGSFRRDLFDRIGGFDESLLSNEDYEFNTRIRNNGGMVYLDPRIRCQYIARGTWAALVKQYFRYGYWKFQMLRRYPKSLRWRQAIPPAFVMSLVGLGILSLFFALARYLLGLEIIVYLIALMAGTIRATVKSQDFRLALGIPAAIASMHIAWGSGFIWSLVKTIFQRPSSTAKFNH